MRPLRNSAPVCGRLVASTFAIAFSMLTALLAVFSASGAPADVNDMLFIHHSVGRNWLEHSLESALLAKPYIDELNEITYGTDVNPDTNRPDSLPKEDSDGHHTEMEYWLFWFNDYLGALKAHDSADGYNQIIMFKSCFIGNSEVYSDGSEPGDPFVAETIADYKAIFRHPDGSGNVYHHDGHTYFALEDIFAANPDILFIPVTIPPKNPALSTDERAQRLRDYHDWLVEEWLPAYNAAHPGLHNVAVFDIFDNLAYPEDHAHYPNRLRHEYVIEGTNSHPNDVANRDLTEVFATNSPNFIDSAWETFSGGTGSSSLSVQKMVSPSSANTGDALNFTIILKNNSGETAPIVITSTIPNGLDYIAHSLQATGGSGDDSSAPTLYWQDAVAAGNTVTITYQATVETSATRWITSSAVFHPIAGSAFNRTAVLLTNGHHIFQPLIIKSR